MKELGLFILVISFSCMVVKDMNKLYQEWLIDFNNECMIYESIIK